MIKWTSDQKAARALLSSDSRHIELRGGARCLSGDAVLDGHTLTIAELSERGEPVRVVTSHGEQWADAPFQKGVAELIRFEMEDGRSVTVTPDHQFWDGQCWRNAETFGSGQRLAVRPPQSAAFRHRSSSDICPSGSLEDGRHCRQTPQGWLDRYLPHPHRYDGQPRFSAEADRASDASEHGAAARSREDRRAAPFGSGSQTLLLDRPAPSRSLAGQSSSRLSMLDGDLAGRRSERWSMIASERASEPSPRSRPEHRQSAAQSCPELSLLQALLLDRQSGQSESPYACPCDVPASAGYVLHQIKSITRAAKQAYFTLHVPGCEHYFANGIMHHNSGKTAVLIDVILTRALSAKFSRHLIARFRGNSLGSIFGPTGTFFWVLANNYPPEIADRLKHNSEKGFYTLPNGSEIWYGGLDDPKRVDKLLGNEYVDILINEASQVPYGSFTTVLTRLAQVVKRDDGEGNLRQRCYVDDNPPPESHWLPILFQKKRDPISKRPLLDPMAYTSMVLNPEGNKENLDPAFLEALQQLPERQRKRFYEGKNGDAGEAALWTSELLDQQRILDNSRVPRFVRKVVSIDPSGADDVEDTAADEIGIGVVALGEDGRAYVLEDLTMRGSPAEWGKVATDAYDRHDADCIVGEANFGGAMVRHVVQTAKPGVPYREVTATRGKHLRAEPVSALYEVDKVKHVGRFPELEDEMLSMTTAGYTGTKSPNRLDWLVQAVTELFPKIISQARRDEDAKSLSRPLTPQVKVGHSRWKRFGGGR